MQSYGFFLRVGLLVGNGLFAAGAEEGVEVVFEDEADALGGQGGLYVEVAVVEVVVGFEAPVAASVEEVFDVEVSDELVVVEGFVAIAEVAVEKEAVVEQG